MYNNFILLSGNFIMSEKEKMLRGELYKAIGCEELSKERAKVKDICFEYNSTPPSDLKKRYALIRQIIGKTKEKLHIESNFYCDYGYNIEIGENFYMNHNCTILDCAKVTFGDNVFVGPNCGFYTAIHPLDVKTRNEGMEWAEPITVGNNVWFGGSVTVLPGVTIGDNTVIGAGSVVVKDIPSNVVAVGNPCKVIKTIDK